MLSQQKERKNERTAVFLFLLLAHHLVSRSEDVLLGLVRSARLVQNLHDILSRDILDAFGANLRMVGLQTLQQHLLVRGHTRASEHGSVLGHPDQEHEALSHRRAGSGLVEGVHLENSVQHLAVVQLVHQSLQTVVAIAEHLQGLVLGELEQDPVHVRLLLLELLPHVLERHIALLHVVLVASEVDILRGDVENVFVGGVAAGSTVQLTDDDVLRHLLQSVHLETNMGSLAIRPRGKAHTQKNSRTWELMVLTRARSMMGVSLPIQAMNTNLGRLLVTADLFSSPITSIRANWHYKSRFSMRALPWQGLSA